MKELQATGIVSEVVKNLTTFAPFVFLLVMMWKTRPAVSLKLQTVKADLSEAHVLFQLVKSISQQVVSVGIVIRKDGFLRIGHGFIEYRICSLQNASDEKPTAWKRNTIIKEKFYDNCL